MQNQQASIQRKQPSTANTITNNPRQSKTNCTPYSAMPQKAVNPEYTVGITSKTFQQQCVYGSPRIYRLQYKLQSKAHTITTNYNLQ
eukprot:gene3414-2365_t